jgi:hypothetical protein
LHPAVSRISNPQTFGQPGGVENPAPSRLEIGDTADLEICATKNFVLHPLKDCQHRCQIDWHKAG